MSQSTSHHSSNLNNSDRHVKDRVRSKQPLRFFQKIYNQQVFNSKKRGHQPPNYTMLEFLNWLGNQEPYISEMWEEYESSGYDKNLAPSVDRVDPSKPYTLGNIELVTWKVNDERARQARISGKDSLSKRVSCYTLGGAFIRDYDSISIAARQLNLNKSGIVSNLKGRTKSCGKMKWKYT